MTVGERIKEQREFKGISQIELAKACKISKQNLYKYENNIITNIPCDKIELIAQYMSISPAYLMGWENNSHNNSDNKHNISLNDEEFELISNYRKINNPGRKKMLEYSSDLLSNPKFKQEIVKVLKIARSEDNHSAEFLEISRENLDKLHSMPMTDEDL